MWQAALFDDNYRVRMAMGKASQPAREPAGGRSGRCRPFSDAQLPISAPQMQPVCFVGHQVRLIIF